jgi:hypothetical protein
MSTPNPPKLPASFIAKISDEAVAPLSLPSKIVDIYPLDA